MTTSLLVHAFFVLGWLAFHGNGRRTQASIEQIQGLLPKSLSLVEVRSSVDAESRSNPWISFWRRVLRLFLPRKKNYMQLAKEKARIAHNFRISGAAERTKPFKWFIVDDQVMGGSSSSSVSPKSDGSIEFVGTINRTGGGFSSCRTLYDSEPLGFPFSSNFVELTAIADSRQYKLTLHTSDSSNVSVPVWAHDFRSANPGKRHTWKLPLKDFSPSKQGRPISGLVLNPCNITGVGVSLSLYNMHGEPNAHFGDGPFKFVLESLVVHA